MRAWYAGLWVVLPLALAACGKQDSGDRAPAAAPAAVTATASPPPAAPRQKTAEPAAEQPSKITRLNEDGSETVEDVTGDTGARNPLLAAVSSTVTAATSTAAAAANGPVSWQDGVNYTRLVPAQPTAVPPGQVEVLEFFWYACPHCNGIDPMVEAWKKNKPAYVSFSRVPVMWNEGHRSLARLFYTLESLGKLDQLHGEIFKEIHVNGNPLVSADDAESERMQIAFVKRFGIPEDAFRTAYQSFAVETDLQKADQLVQRYRVDGVPTFVVNGKYVTDVRTAGGPENLLSLISDLAAQEHRH
jgi:thiol:disulfide interchange protein DsbA